MKILLTGVAGTGKSTIARELNKRSVKAIDLHDVPGIFYWQDKKTKEKVTYTPGRPREWFDAVERLCDVNKLKEMLADSDEVIMAGVASGNQGEWLPLFDKVILLHADSQTLVHRMQTRTNKTGYGKAKSEQADNVEWQKTFDPLILSKGAIPMSTQGDLDTVIARILEISKKQF